MILLLLMAVVLVSLGLPLAGSIASGEARALYADRLADLALFASRVPTAPGSGEVEAGAMQPDLNRYDELYGIAVTVYDAAGRPRVSSRRPVGSTPSAVRTALAGRLTDPPARLLPWRRLPLVVGQPVVRDGDVVGAVVSVSPTDRARHRVERRWLVLGGAELLALFGAAVLTGRLASWLLRPVARLDEGAHQISAGDLGARVPTGSGPPELRRLEHSFNDMARHVQEAVEAQRAFVADASHQLRNPLATLLIRLEAMQLAAARRRPGGSLNGPGGDDERPGEAPHHGIDLDTARAVDSALADGRHLAGTLDRMLALATVEHTGASAGPVDVAAIVDERLDSWRVLAERRSIAVQRLGTGRAWGHHEIGALAGALDAVLDNSLKYSPEHSTVSVEVTGTAATVSVVVIDDGPGVAADELDRLPERFWRSSRKTPSGNGLDSGTGSGTGLGLSIAKTLLERHHGRLEITTTPDRGLRVALLVPSALQ